MSSKGSPRRTLRVREELCQRIEAAISSANARRADVPYDWSAWALKAITEKLAHLERGRTSSRRRRPVRRHNGVQVDQFGQPVEGTAHLPISRE